MAALTGVLAADFSSFYQAVQKAEVSLKSFETGSSKVESQLNKMVDGFSGRRVIQEATLMSEAIERSGGVTRLTASELERAGAKAAEAADKMRALGMDVPAGIKNIADEAHKANTAHQGLTDTVKTLAVSFGAMFSARAAFNFINSTLSEASALKDLSQQTHINVEELQLMTGAMSEFGVDSDTLGKGLFTLSRKIAHGDDSISDALKTMGLSLQDLDGLNGEELFLKIEHGLSTLQGGLRDDTASEIFGSRLGMAMAGASEDIEGAMATARQLNTVMSEESVDALDAYGEAIERTQKSLGAMAANLMGPVAEGINTLIDAANKGAKSWQINLAMVRDSIEGYTGLGTGTEHLTRLLDQLNQQTVTHTASTRAATSAQVMHTPTVHAHTRAVKDAADVGVIWGDGMAGVDARAAKLDAGILAMNEKTLPPFIGLLKNIDKTLTPLPVEVEAFRSGLVLTAETIEEDVSPAIEKVVEHILSLSEAMDKVRKGEGTLTGTITPDLSDAGKKATQKAWESGTYYGPVIGGTADNPRGSGPDFAKLGYRAMGGPVTAGRPYMVGERGPELFIPKTSGNVLPSGAGSPITINLTVNGSVVSSFDEFKGLVTGAIFDVFKTSGLALPSPV